MPCPAFVIPRFVVGKHRLTAHGLRLGFHFIKFNFPFHLCKGNRHAPVLLVGIDRIHLAPVREVPCDDSCNGIHAPQFLDTPRQETLLQRVEIL